MMGVKIFEKHVKLNNRSGLDSKFSKSLKDFKKYVSEINISHSSLGIENFNINILEGPSKKHRRSIFISKDVLKNEILTEKNVSVVRPASGLHPKFYKKILGKNMFKFFIKSLFYV